MALIRYQLFEEVPMKLLYLVAQSEDSIFFQKVWNPKDSYLVFDKNIFQKGYPRSL